jgi:hypothetical protein
MYYTISWVYNTPFLRAFHEMDSNLARSETASDRFCCGNAASGRGVAHMRHEFGPIGDSRVGLNRLRVDHMERQKTTHKTLDRVGNVICHFQTVLRQVLMLMVSEGGTSNSSHESSSISLQTTHATQLASTTYSMSFREPMTALPLHCLNTPLIVSAVVPAVCSAPSWKLSCQT